MQPQIKKKKNKIQKIINKKKKDVLKKVSHPECYSKLTQKEINEFKNDNCLFMRKVNSKCNIDLIYNTI